MGAVVAEEGWGSTVGVLQHERAGAGWARPAGLSCGLPRAELPRASRVQPPALRNCRGCSEGEKLRPPCSCFSRGRGSWLQGPELSCSCHTLREGRELWHMEAERDTGPCWLPCVCPASRLGSSRCPTCQEPWAPRAAPAALGLGCPQLPRCPQTPWAPGRILSSPLGSLPPLRAAPLLSLGLAASLGPPHPLLPLPPHSHRSSLNPQAPPLTPSNQGGWPRHRWVRVHIPTLSHVGPESASRSCPHVSG